jgi:hypothetical protein
LKPIARRARIKRTPISKVLTPEQRLDRKLLRILRSIVMQRDPVCRICKRRPSTDTMHLIGRSARRVRYDPENAMGGCRECHDHMTRHSKQWARWWQTELGLRRAEALLARAADPRQKFDITAAEARLNDHAKETK